MSDIEETTDERDPIAEAILHGGTPPIPEQAEPVESGADVVDDAPVDELLLGKFKSPDDLADAYKNLESQFTQNNQRLSELEALLMNDEYDEPAQPWGLSFNGEPNNEEELVGWAERDPGAAAQWAISNNDRVPAETVNSLWEHWFETKPAEANAWYVQQQTQQIAQQYEQQLADLREQITPLRDQQTQALFESSLEALSNQIPDLADYGEKIQEYIGHIPDDQLHLAFFPNGMDTPEKIQEGVKSLYAIVRMRETPVQPVAQQAQQSAFTQSRQGVVDTGAEDYVSRINNAILNA